MLFCFCVWKKDVEPNTVSITPEIADRPATPYENAEQHRRPEPSSRDDAIPPLYTRRPPRQPRRPPLPPPPAITTCKTTQLHTSLQLFQLIPTNPICFYIVDVEPDVEQDETDCGRRKYLSFRDRQAQLTASFGMNGFYRRLTHAV